MMESMSVRPEQVTALSEKIRGGAGGIKNELDNLDKEVKGLIGAWDGEAKEAYSVAQVEWNKSLTALQELLGTIATKTQEISSAYTQSDKSSAGLF
jgi:WXG100 family type VII secretion target